MFKKLLSFFNKNKQPKKESSYANVKVWFDNENAWVHWPSKEPMSVSWTELIGVAVETTYEGPFMEDVYWHLASKEQVVTYPNEANGAKKILERLQQIPTFSNERLIEAMSCTNNQTFILWDVEGRHE